MAGRPPQQAPQQPAVEVSPDEREYAQLVSICAELVPGRGGWRL